MVNIYVHLAEGFEEIEALTPVDVLRRAGYHVTMVSISGKKEVTGSHGITVVADELFEQANYDKANMILLPGGMPGSKNLDEHAGLRARILEFNNQGKELAAICAAPMVYGHLGILKGKTATCYPGKEPELEGATVTTNAVEVDGNIITSRGVGTALLFALAIVEKYSGKKQATELAAKMVANY
jgi:4-methyl-5(b-hydroxyethyl)-thiazole monophosphate biosynthesis